tara:strand:+ start:523 stop:750 length:228 start_codon:yes stop_codon:yes gene_type:complete
MSETKTCPKCGATWVDGQHYWSGTGALGNEDDLAGLVCNKLGNDDCINPKRGSEIGITWQDRMDFLNKRQNEMDQ